MIYDEDLFWPVAAEFSNGKWQPLFDIRHDLQPTHWMPLPASPEPNP